MAAEEEKKLVKENTELSLSVYDYTNYRKFLRDYYDMHKESKRGYSFRNFSKAAGFTSPNFVKLVMDGERNLSSAAVEKCIAALRLVGNRAAYFRVLVQMNQAKTDVEREAAYLELRRLVPHAKRKLLDAESHDYLSHWLYPVLREMVLLPGFREDPYWITLRLRGRVQQAEVVAALRFLVQHGFLRRDDAGKLQPTDHMILTSDEVRSLAIRNYHRQMLDGAKYALESIPMDEREFGALTLTLPSSALEELKLRMKMFRQDLHRWAMESSEGGAGEAVIQVNLQMYPHTVWLGGKK